MGFLSPLLLWALALVAIPILIHLFYFRRYKKIYFSSTQFLREVKEQQKKAGKLQQWLILACRIAAVVFIVLAFAQPFFGGKAEKSSGKQRSVVIYLDNTFSMNLEKSGQSMLGTAIQTAEKLLQSLSPDDQVMILSNNLDGHLQRWMRPEEAIPFLKEINISPSTRNIDEIRSRIGAVFREIQSDAKLVYFLSDMQEYSLPKTWTDNNYQSLLVPIQSERKQNIYIDSIWMAEPVVYKQAINKMLLRLGNSGNDDISTRVSFELNGELGNVHELNLKANSTFVDTLSFSIRNVGQQKGSVRIEDFPVKFDDAFYFSFQVASSNRVLLLEEVSSGRAVYKVFQSDPHFAAEKIDHNRAEINSFKNYNLIVLNELSYVNSSISSALVDYVKNGGCLYIIPSDEMNLSSYNDLLSTLGTGALSPLIKTSARVQQINQEEAIVQTAFDKFPKNIDLPTIQQYFPINTNAQVIEKSILKLDNGRSYLNAYDVENGRVYLQASSLKSNSTDFSGKAIFPPLVFNMAVFKASPKPLYYIIAENTPIKGIERTGNGDQVLKMRSGNEEIIPPVQAIGNWISVLIPQDLKKDGIYELSKSGEVKDVIAVNFSRKESDMKFANEAQLREKYGDELPEIIPYTNILQGSGTSGIDSSTSLWKLCLILAAIFLLAEMLLIRFATPKTTA